MPLLDACASKERGDKKISTNPNVFMLLINIIWSTVLNFVLYTPLFFFN